MRSRRRRHVPPDLTSLFDVLFIVIFAALIRAAAAEHAVAEAAKPPKPQVNPPKILDPASLHARAVGQLERELEARDAVVVRVSAAGIVTAVEHAGQVTPLDLPLTEPSANPDVVLTYLGDRSVELRACKIAALHAGVDPAGALVVIAPERSLEDLPHALATGLRRDVERCDGGGLAVIVEPK